MKHTQTKHISISVGTAFVVGIASFHGAATVSASDGYPPRYQVLSDPSQARNEPVRKKRGFKPIAPSAINLRSETTQQTSAQVVVEPFRYPSYEVIEPPIPVSPPLNYQSGPRIAAPPIPAEPMVSNEMPELEYTSSEVTPEPEVVIEKPKPKAKPKSTVTKSSYSSSQKSSNSKSSWPRWGSRSRSGSNCKT